MKYTNPTKTKSWKTLIESKKNLMNKRICALFSEEKDRLKHFSKNIGSLYFDFSKNLIDEDTLQHLIYLAEQMEVKKNIEYLFEGRRINETENRAVLHTSLRGYEENDIMVDGQPISGVIKEELKKIENITHKVHQGQWKGFTGKMIKNIVNIGIGGSDLGPQFVVDALEDYKHLRIKTFFVSNIDGAHLSNTLKQVDMEETLFLIVSKTFSTMETMTNFNSLKEEFLAHAKDEKHISKHFVAVTSNIEEAMNHSIPEENIFSFWDWVGGRYSLWSSVGLSISLSVGFEHFKTLLEGAKDIDKHIRHADLQDNIPLLMALISLWNTNFLYMHTEAIIPYSQNLRLLPMYLQQLSLESNGKQVDRNGQFVDYKTAPILWGDAGTNAQHSFFQTLHQGTIKVPCDFILFKKPNHKYHKHHQKLIANCIAQSEALMNGKLLDKHMDNRDFDRLEKKDKYRIFIGNIPNTIIAFDSLSPFSLGQLISMYEHKTFFLGILLNIYSFDQWGVELGKSLTKKILKDVDGGGNGTSHDPSTNLLITKYL